VGGDPDQVHRRRVEARRAAWTGCPHQAAAAGRRSPSVACYVL
jgi:hypothetical protein